MIRPNHLFGIGLLLSNCRCATNLYDNGVPEQVIQETTGHRSVEGVRAYKRTSSAMKHKMSAVLNQLESSLGRDHENRNTEQGCCLTEAQ